MEAFQRGACASSFAFAQRLSWCDSLERSRGGIFPRDDVFLKSLPLYYVGTSKYIETSETSNQLSHREKFLSLILPQFHAEILAGGGGGAYRIFGRFWGGVIGTLVFFCFNHSSRNAARLLCIRCASTAHPLRIQPFRGVKPLSTLSLSIVFQSLPAPPFLMRMFAAEVCGNCLGEPQVLTASAESAESAGNPLNYSLASKYEF